jgi:hypothetical protein
LLEEAGVKGKKLEHYSDQLWEGYKSYLKATVIPALG